MPDSHKIHPQLPDYIQPGIHILMVGINPGLRSARTGHHFAGYSNRFWKLLYESGLVTEPLTHREDWRLPQWRLGLTNIITRSSPGIDVLTPEEYRGGRVRLERIVRRYQPRIVAFLGLTICRMLFPGDRRWEVGRTGLHVAGVPLFLLPNPSGRNAHYSYSRMLTAFQELRALATEPAVRSLHVSR